MDVQELEWLEKCMVGVVKNIDYLNEINFLLYEAGFHQCVVKYLGGLKVLLEWPSIECMKKALEDGHPALLEWFVSVEPWNKSLEAKSASRLVWLMIQGVPLHVWTKEVFHTIAAEWGEVVDVEELTSSKEQTLH